MTTIDPNVPDSDPDQLHLAVEKTGRLDHWIEIVSQHLNPILIKESRQSLKSNQFVVTFGLVLLATVVWSFAGIGTIRGLARGQDTLVFLSGFFWILLFPLTIVVPVWTFWSILAEREENSLELVTLSTMRPSQIVNGKFVTALLQSMIYLSAVAPGIFFAYLLRGIEPIHIFSGMFVIIGASVCLICFGVFLATSSAWKLYQVVFLLVFVAMCFSAFIGLGAMLADVDGFVSNVIRTNGDDALERWLFFGIVLLIATYAGVTYAAAISNITFEADNRSTMIRWALVIQQCAFVGWAFAFCCETDMVAIIFLPIVAAIHWCIAGSMLMGDSPFLSHRVRRGLPKYPITRVLFSWFMPGPTRGYFFAIANVWAIGFMALVTAAIYELNFGFNIPPVGMRYGIMPMIFFALFYTCAYPTIYLGLTNIVVSWTRRKSIMGPTFSFIVCLVVSALMIFVPLLIALSVDMFEQGGLYSIVAPSWPAAFLLTAGGRTPPWDLSILIPVLAMLAFVLIYNVWLLRIELSFHREAAPLRVQQEIEAEMPPTIPQEVDIFAEDS